MVFEFSILCLIFIFNMEMGYIEGLDGDDGGDMIYFLYLVEDFDGVEVGFDSDFWYYEYDMD